MIDECDGVEVRVVREDIKALKPEQKNKLAIKASRVEEARQRQIEIDKLKPNKSNAITSDDVFYEALLNDAEK